MAKYMKKPIPVEVEQWEPGKTVDGVWGANGGYFIVTRGGMLRVKPGDYIITGVKGEKYPCDKEIFEETYEAVGDGFVAPSKSSTGLLHTQFREKKLYTAIANDDLHEHPHTWKKGLDYQMIVKGDRIKLASEQGETGYPVERTEHLKELFTITEGWND